MDLQKKHLKMLFYTLTLISTTWLILYSISNNTKSDTSEYTGSSEVPVVSIEEAFPYIVERNSSLFAMLTDLNVPGAAIQHIVTAAKPFHNLARLMPGIRFQIFKSPETNEVVAIEFRFSAVERLYIQRRDSSWVANKFIEQVDLHIVTFSGTVTSSLWESAQKAKMDPNLISELADIFAWEVDFAREVRLGDRWRLTVEQKMIRGELVGWGAILAAEYENAGTPFQAVLFRVNGEEMGYFTPEGVSLRKMFLKSPIRYGRITSGFSRRRFHPILKVNRAHLGVDYAAPTGTPIRTIGDGTVTMAGRNGGAGNMIKIRHNSSFQTAYKHLKGFASGIRNGTKVKQGQVIGYVGTTGLSTGPHLHFEFYQNGNYIDPLRKKFNSAEPVPKDLLNQFKAEASMQLTALPSWSLIELSDISSESSGGNGSQQSDRTN